VTTLRDGNINKAPPTTRKSRSRSGSGGWSSDNGNHKRSRKSRRDWSRSTSPLIPLREARAIKEAAEEAVNKEFSKKQKAEDERLKEKEMALEQEAAEIEKRMEREANSLVLLYSPNPSFGHTPPTAPPSQKETPTETTPIDEGSSPTANVNEIYTNEELTAA
jgi:hypothetical protein